MEGKLFIERARSVRRYFKYLREYKLHCILGPIAKWIEAVLELLVPLVMASIIDVGVAGGDVSYVLWGGAVMLAMGIVGFFCAIFCQRSASITSQGFGTNVRNALFSHINTLSGRELDKIGAASLLTRTVNDVNQMQNAVAMIIRLVVRAPFIALGSVILCMVIDWQIGLVVLAVAALVGAVLWIIMKKSVPYYTANQKKLDRLTQITNENLEGARVVRAFCSRDRERARFDAAAEDMLQNSLHIGRISAWLNPLTYAIVNFGVALILLWSGFKVDAGALSSGEIVALINYMVQILNAMIVISNLVSLFTKAHASMGRVSEVFDLAPSVTDGAGAQPDFSAPAVAFEGVSFSYAGTDRYSLRDVDAVIPRGATVGVIGGTGSAKTTLVSLIPRLYDVTAGEVLVDGRNVKDYTIYELRESVSMVLQNNVLFSGSILDNLRWGDENATEEEIVEACKAAQADDFIRAFPDGYHTDLGQGGVNVSGGQKQRLCIARALLKKPKILILDDSTSAVDTVTDSKIREAFRTQIPTRPRSSSRSASAPWRTRTRSWCSTAGSSPTSARTKNCSCAARSTARSITASKRAARR